jgi:tetratricopeptide (TPR) repeat protein
MSSTDGVTVSQGGADPESPWLGLRSFSEDTQQYFFGRTTELQDLLERVLHKPLTVLFGQSGLGKTSLIQAGLIPNLRDARLVPIRLRLRFDAEAPLPGRQMLEALRDELQNAGAADLASACDKAGDLWLLLHDPRSGFIQPDGSAIVRPVFVFDQFEEIFTLGESRRNFADEFRETIAAIVENRMPAAVRAQVESDDRLADQIDYQARPAKVLLSLREDYLHLLERWRHQLPAVMDNRMELRPLSGRQALQVVTEPGKLRPGRPAIVDDAVAAGIVRFVAGVRSDVPLDEIDAVPPLLSLTCAELNARRIAAGEETISADQLEGRTGHILEKFYSDAFAGQPEAVRTFVEDRLLSEAGYRQAVTLDTAEAELARSGLPNDQGARAIAGLVERRLLTVEERGAVRRVELTHDVLAPVASASRLRRRERETAAEVSRRQQQRLRRQRRIALVVVLVLVAGCAALLTYAWRARQQLRFRQLVDASFYDLDSGDYSSALARFREATGINAAEPDAWFGIGDSLVRQAYGSGDARNTPLLEEAIKAYNKAVAIAKKKDATSAEHYAGKAKLAQAYVGLGDVYALGASPDFAKATALYQQAETIDPESPDPHIGYGNVAFEQGKLRAALAEYEKALAAAKQRGVPSYGAHAGLGATYLNLGEYALAIEELHRSIGANPNASVATYRLATATYLGHTDDNRAAELFKGLLESKMVRLASLARTSLAYMQLKAAAPSEPVPQQAVKDLEQTYHADPYAFSAFRLGIARALEGNTAEAQRLWDEASRLSWGDSLSNRIYTPFLHVLLNQPNALEDLRAILDSLAVEGAAGVLENVRLDAELIQRSGRYSNQIDPVVTLLDQSIAKARQNRPVNRANNL